MAGIGNRTIAVLPANLTAARRALIRNEAQTHRQNHAHLPQTEATIRGLAAASVAAPAAQQHDAVVTRLTDLAFPIQIMQAAAMDGRLVSSHVLPESGAGELIESVAPVDAVAAMGGGGAGTDGDPGTEEDHALIEAQGETFEPAFDPNEMIIDQMIADLAREHRQLANVALSAPPPPVREPAKNWFRRLAGRN